MQFEFIQLFGLVSSVIGWVGVIMAGSLPAWKVTHLTSGTAVQILSQGLWENCTWEMPDQLNCTLYDSLPSLTTDIRIFRAMIIISILVGLSGWALSITCGRLNAISLRRPSTARNYSEAAGALHIVSAFLCIIAVCWCAMATDYAQILHQTMNVTVGVAVYIGLISGILLAIGGTLQCSYPPTTA